MKKKLRLKNKLPLIFIGLAFALIVIELSAGTYGFFYLKARQQLFASKKKSGHIRILCLGDSFTFGLDVNKNESYPAQLQKTLDNSDLSAKCTVINQGIPGTNSSVLAHNFNSYIQRSVPDIIIILIGNADFGIFNDIDSMFKPKSFSIFKTLYLRFRQHFFSIQNDIPNKTIPEHTSQTIISENPRVLELIHTGNELRNKYLYDEALLCYKQALEIAPQDQAAHLELLRNYKFAKHFQAAADTAFDLLNDQQANLDIYIELANIFQIIDNGWDFIYYTYTWQKNNSPSYLLIPDAKGSDSCSKQELQKLIEKAYDLYSLGLNDAAFDAYINIYRLFNAQAIFQKDIFAKCPEQVKHELLTMFVYGISDALLQENLDYIISISKSYDIKMLFLSYPEFLPAAATAAAQKHQIPLLDLRPVFQPLSKTLNSKNLDLLLPSGHCTAKGNKLIAEQITAYLKKDLMIKDIRQ